MMYAHVVNATIDQTAGVLPSQATRLDDPTKIILGFPTASIADQQACGWFAVTDTAQPVPAAGHTSDRTVQNVAGTWTVVWVDRLMTTQETADATANTNRATILAQAATALTNNATYIALAAPTTAQNTAQIKALSQQVDKLIRLATNVLDAVT